MPPSTAYQTLCFIIITTTLPAISQTESDSYLRISLQQTISGNTPRLTPVRFEGPLNQRQNQNPPNPNTQFLPTYWDPDKSRSQTRIYSNVAPLGRNYYYHTMKHKHRRKFKYRQFLEMLNARKYRFRNQIDQIIFPNPKARFNSNQATTIIPSNETIGNGDINMISSDSKLPVSRPSRIGTKDLCYRYDVNGCSIPFGAPFFFKKLFTRSCDRHDICYHCGVKFGIKRPQCDQMFNNNMWRTCLAKYKKKINNNKNNNNSSNNIGEEISRKRMVVAGTETLLNQFDDILQKEMSSYTISSGNFKKDVEKFKIHSKLVRRQILTRWVGLLTQFVTTKNNQRLSSLTKSRLESNLSTSNGYTHEGRDNSSATEQTEAYQNITITKVSSDEHQTNFTSRLCRDVLLSNAEINFDENNGIDCDEVDLLSCGFVRDLYFFAVRVFGASSYHDTPESYCGQPFVRKCLQPITPTS